MQILFVCRGNVGRSQIAEAILKKILPIIDVKSAGTKVIDKVGSSVHGTKLGDFSGAENVIMCLKEFDIDVSENIRKQLTSEDVKNADKIVVMAEKETVPDYLAESNKVEYWDVEDLKEKTLEVHREVRNQIKELVEDLITRLEF